MCKFGVRDEFGPCCGIIATEDLEVCKFPLLDLLVLSHCLFVGERWWIGIGHIIGAAHH